MLTLPTRRLKPNPSSLHRTQADSTSAARATALLGLVAQEPLGVRFVEGVTDVGLMTTAFTKARYQLVSSHWSVGAPSGAAPVRRRHFSLVERSDATNQDGHQRGPRTG